MNYTMTPEQIGILIGAVIGIIGAVGFLLRAVIKFTNNQTERIEELETRANKEYAEQRHENDELKKEVRELRDEVAVMRGRLEERENQRTHLLSENSKKDIELGATRQKWKDTLDENTKLSERLNTALKVIESKEIELAEALESKDTLLKVSEAKYNQAEREITGLKATIALLKDQLEARSVVKELIAVVSEQPSDGEMKAPESSADPSVEQNEGELDQGAKG